MLEELLEAWRTNHRITMYLLDNVSDAGLGCTLSKRGGRDVARQFAHMHDVRRYHLEKRARDLGQGLRKFASKDSPGREDLVEALDESADRITQFLADVFAGVPKRRGFKKGIFTTLAYFVAHESHHRGSIVLTLKECGHPVPKDVRDGIWGWDQL